jgi:hypothetical protein
MYNNPDWCVQNSKFWHFLHRLQKTNPKKKIVLTPAQRYNLCNYMNGKPYSREVLKDFI